MEVGPVGKFYNRPLWGRTAGMLGYGALGRETARLLKAHGMRIIAANSSGQASRFEDWTPEGTGDLDGESVERTSRKAGLLGERHGWFAPYVRGNGSGGGWLGQ